MKNIKDRVAPKIQRNVQNTADLPAVRLANSATVLLSAAELAKLAARACGGSV
ncbi:hypothetical protein L1285_20910 [Pseudoalteromonas sp. DL2-H2.2]|uniref:hypothetical protein n=1 Tax=Pseudoalteromonas sp. DL2-H2.2 TaxID=2908889 RepID=UPI001F277D14|nr:hypothetical protein [Pseudoalteromonas sp. DL2-H2.2]MCF2910772.1 hypothetical protein [Pseudoalteromonas sp. DL2-H2.2]